MPAPSIYFFMTAEDEGHYSSELALEIEGINFVDTLVRPPKTERSIAECSGIKMFISRGTYSGQPFAELPPMLQVLRCKKVAGDQVLMGRLGPGAEALTVGRLSIVYPDGDCLSHEFSKSAFAVLRRMSTNRLRVLNPVAECVSNAVRDYFVGRAAARWHKSGGLLHGNDFNLYFTLE